MTAWTPDPDAWKGWFPSQECPGCGAWHPGQECPQQEALPVGQEPARIDPKEVNGGEDQSTQA